MNYFNTTHKKSATVLFFVTLLCLLTFRLSMAQDQANVMTDDIEFSCEQSTDNSTIKCAYRLVKPEIIKQITASLDIQELPIKDIKTYPYADSTTSILLLVDTSKANSYEAFAQIKEHLNTFAQQALPHQQIGLASFDARLNILKPLGSDPGEIVSASDDLIETEQPTELYGNMIDAIKLLETSQADRKALYLFSNGQSEDQAVYRSDVIQAALDANIKIISIAYPTDTQSETDLPQSSKAALNNLHQLARKTGGLYIKSTEARFELPESLLADPFAVIDNGGSLTIDLTPVLANNTGGLQLSVLVIETLKKKISVKLPLQLEPDNMESPSQSLVAETTTTTGAANKPAVTESAQKQAETQSPITPVVATTAEIEPELVINKTASQSEFSLPFPVYWLLVPLALLTLGFWMVLSKRTKSSSNSKKRSSSKQKKVDGDKLACLVSLTDESKSFIIENTPWTIGRTRQNDLFLEHSSVSRHHAEIKHNRDGTYTIVDLDSLNGVFVNNTKVSTGLLKEDDKLDIGDMRMRFVFKQCETRKT